MKSCKKINIIGGGLAGCEAAYQISKVKESHTGIFLKKLLNNTK